MKRTHLLLLFLLTLIACVSCKKFRRPGLPFGDVKRTHFTEVRRVFSNGLMFDKQGYQLEPSWNLYFISDDSVMVFSPKMKRYYGFHVYFDHDSIFNMVDAWFKVKKIAADSLVFQALRVEEKVILDDDEGSKVFLTFYSDRYIKDHDAGKIQRMGMPGKNDTTFIRSRSVLANTKSANAFAARKPVVLKSKSPLVKVAKVKNESTPLVKTDPSDDYLAPEYNITIHKAYENFDYSFYVFVDDKGRMSFRKSTINYFSESKSTYEGIMKGIINGYLQHYLAITPGSTLGINHTSSILLNVEGKTE